MCSASHVLHLTVELSQSCKFEHVLQKNVLLMYTLASYVFVFLAKPTWRVCFFPVEIISVFFSF